MQKGVYNKLEGSLADLKNLTKLESLEISNTDIIGDPEDLPSSIREIRYSTEARPDSKVKSLVSLKQLAETNNLDKVVFTDADYFQKIKDSGRLVRKESQTLYSYFLFTDRDVLDKFKKLCKV